MHSTSFRADELAHTPPASRAARGYAGASFSGRMPCAEIADAIVACGRRALEEAADYIEAAAPGAKVVYGDTDSVFVELKARRGAGGGRHGALELAGYGSRCRRDASARVRWGSALTQGQAPSARCPSAATQQFQVLVSTSNESSRRRATKTSCRSASLRVSPTSDGKIVAGLFDRQHMRARPQWRRSSGCSCLRRCSGMLLGLLRRHSSPTYHGLRRTMGCAGPTPSTARLACADGMAWVVAMTCAGPMDCADPMSRGLRRCHGLTRRRRLGRCHGLR